MGLLPSVVSTNLFENLFHNISPTLHAITVGLFWTISSKQLPVRNK